MDTSNMTNVTEPNDLILLTGASGYVGGRLMERLLQRGAKVRALARHPERLRLPSGTTGTVSSIKGDVLDYDSLLQAMQGVDTAYYLVHSMGAAKNFERIDRIGAQNFARAAGAAGVKRMIYLGGLAHATEDTPLSSHMASRMEVGEVLRSSGVPVIEFRASIVIGSGSLSFEMIRALVERLPMMITPRWVSIKAQPIGIEDLLEYLLAALELNTTASRIYEIGGRDRTSYGGLMQAYAKARGLRRRMIPVPVLTPRLSSLWLGLVTPLYARVGKKLIASIRNASVVEDATALQDFTIQPQGIDEIIAAALRNEDREFAQTRWSDALSSSGTTHRWGGKPVGARLVDSRRTFVTANASDAFAPIEIIGGEQGWYYADWIWRLRGWIDLFVGGVGMRRGRRHPVEIAVGDSIDWWRVEDFKESSRLLLRAEMKVPGRAWLEFEVTPREDGSEIRQTALFDPTGVWGRIYWYTLYPIHLIIFAGMLRNISKNAG